MLYEFRIYYPKAGRMEDLNDRFRHHLPVLWDRHGIRCLGYWTGESEVNSPARFMYLLSFKDHYECDRAWNTFQADPQWHSVRQRTNGHEEILNGYDLFFLRERVGTVPRTAPLPVNGRFEFIFQETYHGVESDVDRWLGEYVLPSLNTMGAKNIYCFNVTTGSQLPKLLLIIRWLGESTQKRFTQVAALFKAPVGGGDARHLLKSVERFTGQCRIGISDKL